MAQVQQQLPTEDELDEWFDLLADETQLLIDDANHLGGEYYPGSWHKGEGEITPEDQDSHEYYQEHFKAERGL